MNIIIVDDEHLALGAISRVINDLYPMSTVNTFSSASKAIEYTSKNKVDIAFLDIELPGTNGLELASELQKLLPGINIIFTTGHAEYALPALNLFASGYLLKPITAEAVKKEIENLRHPLNSVRKIVRVQTFGNFEVFINDQPLPFNRNKSKELLAYLIDRNGAVISRRELASVLWEDKDYSRSTQTHLQIIIADLFGVLKSVEAEEILIKRSGGLAVDTKKLDCDFYKLLRGDLQAVNSFHGEYMANYSWSKFTEGSLSSLVGKY